jgi:triosephosphate isomerase
VQKQLLGALHGMDASEISGIVVAYEPVWAIGTGNVCEPDEAERMCNIIRDILSREFSEEATNSIRVLYGGSVNGKNCKDLASMDGIDGFLVGGASLITADFIKIINSI